MQCHVSMLLRPGGRNNMETLRVQKEMRFFISFMRKKENLVICDLFYKFEKGKILKLCHGGKRIR